jgi:hypothetical protein
MQPQCTTEHLKLTEVRIYMMEETEKKVETTSETGANLVSRTKWVILTLVLAVIAFLASPTGPFGLFWRPEVNLPQPTGYQVTLAVAFNIIEVLAFGFGVAFLVYGYPLIQRIQHATKRLRTAVYLSISWLLIGWWPHDSVRQAVGISSMNANLAIDYIFHVTLMIAGVIVASFLLSLFYEDLRQIRHGGLKESMQH